jgi:hypothetical protein
MITAKKEIVDPLNAIPKIPPVEILNLAPAGKKKKIPPLPSINAICPKANLVFL